MQIVHINELDLYVYRFEKDEFVNKTIITKNKINAL